MPLVPVLRRLDLTNVLHAERVSYRCLSQDTARCRQDHLSLFEPLVIDALNQVKTLDLAADEIRGLVFANTNLKIPVPTIQTLLGRCAKEGYLIRSGGRFHKTAKAVPFSNTASALLEVKAEQDFLGLALLDHSKEAGITFDSPECAIQALADFISEHKLEILLQHSPVEPGQDSLKKTRNLARFITERCIPEAVQTNHSSRFSREFFLLMYCSCGMFKAREWSQLPSLS